MSEMKHTPGPWEVYPCRAYTATGDSFSALRIEASSGYCIGVVYDLNGRNENEANARRIAAAPELLEACEEALGALNGAEHALPGYVVAALERAIAKATGEQP